MALIKRTAGVVWSGSIARGSGRLKSGSGTLDGLELTLPSRLGDESDLTTPEELLAAAHAGCFAITLGSVLAKVGTPPEELAVDAVCTLDTTEGNRRIASMELTARGRVPGADASVFEAAVREAEQRCLISRTLAQSVAVTCEPVLESVVADG